MPSSASGKSNFWRPFAIIFNPAWLIAIQTVLAIVLVMGGVYFNWAYVLIVVAPALVYFLYTFTIDRLRPIKLASPYDISMVFGKLEVILAGTMVVIISISNMFLIRYLVIMYGGTSEALNNIGSTSKLAIIQFNTPQIISYMVALNYVLPVAVVPLLAKNNLYKKIVVLAPACLLLLIASGLFGARVLFIDILVTTILITFLKKRFRVKLLLVMLVSVAVVIFALAGLQAERSNLGLKGGFVQLGKYYSVSLNNGAAVIAHDKTEQPLYWSTRSLFGVPIVNTVFGFEAVYEGMFGAIPIKSRKDDFNYAARLGVDPRYNTFGIYGYSFLDAGMYSFLIILASYLIMHYLYRSYIAGSTLGLLMYPGLYALLLDQLRTNSIFSSRAPFFWIVAVFFIVAHYAYRQILSRKNLIATVALWGRKV